RGGRPAREPLGGSRRRGGRGPATTAALPRDAARSPRAHRGARGGGDDVVPTGAGHVSAARGAVRVWGADRHTRRPPGEVRERRRDELASDVCEQLPLASGEQRSSVTWRTVRGIPSDVAWRRQEMRAMRANSPEPHESRLRNAWAVVTQKWFAPIALLVIV